MQPSAKTEDNTSIQKATKIRLRLPDIDWVEIPAGPFLYGEGETQQTLTLERFYIARYPITNCQYRCFIDDNGYRDERWWRGVIRPEPAEPQWKQANRPRETVDWYEAVAFCRWLSYRLGFAISLPTEQQWEKAARGVDGGKYPWGSEFIFNYANVNSNSINTNSNLKQTIGVGLFPQAMSSFGVGDMTGNVLEWCIDKMDQNKISNNVHDGKIMRGGSWLYNHSESRTTFRDWNFQDFRSSDVGFRVVCSSPFSGH